MPDLVVVLYTENNIIKTPNQTWNIKYVYYGKNSMSSVQEIQVGFCPQTHERTIHILQHNLFVQSKWIVYDLNLYAIYVWTFQVINFLAGLGLLVCCWWQKYNVVEYLCIEEWHSANTFRRLLPMDRGLVPKMMKMNRKINFQILSWWKLSLYVCDAAAGYLCY